MQTYSPPLQEMGNEYPKPPPFSQNIEHIELEEENLPLDALDLFILIGSSVLVIGTITSLLFGIFLLLRKTNRSRYESRRSSNSKFVRDDRNVMMTRVNDTDDCLLYTSDAADE